MPLEKGFIWVNDTEAGAVVPPQGHIVAARDTGAFLGSDGATLTALGGGGGGGLDTEGAQDAVGAMVDASLIYTDATPLLSRAALTGDVTASQGSNVTTIANDAVTYAKIQNVTDARLLGRSAGSSGDVQEITVSDGLSLSGALLTTNSRTINIASTPVTVVSSAAETTIYSYTIPASTVSATGQLRLTLLNEWLNNSGASRSLDLRVKLGGTTVIAWNSGNFITSVTRRPIKLEIYLNAMNATNSQQVWLFGTIPAFTAVGTISTGRGSVSTSITSLHVDSGDLTEDMTASKVLEVTIQHSVSNGSLEWKMFSGTLELLQA